MILVMTLQHACSGSLSHFKFQSSSALYCHKWARSQLILNHHIISASGVSTKKSDYVQRHLLKSPRFSKSGRKSEVTPLRILIWVNDFEEKEIQKECSFNEKCLFNVPRHTVPGDGILKDSRIVHFYHGHKSP